MGYGPRDHKGQKRLKWLNRQTHTHTYTLTHTTSGTMNVLYLLLMTLKKVCINETPEFKLDKLISAELKIS